MPKSLRCAYVTLAIGVLAGGSGAACGSTEATSAFPDQVMSTEAGVSDATVPPYDGNTPSFGGDSALGDVVTGDAMQAFDVEPSTMQTITVTAGQPLPKVTFMATASGHAVNAGWSVDRGDLGAVPSTATSADFTPTGTTGGVVTVTAGWNNQTLTRQILVKIVSAQNGATASESAQIPTTVAQLTGGGGVGGVGGEGLGPPADAATAMLFQSPNGDGKTQLLKYLYPYDKTVWPRGLLAPLLMWDWSLGDADAIQIKLTTTSGAFSWTGTFGRPAILAQATGKFIRHPIPQDVWDMATNTAGGKDQITVSLTVAKGGAAYGPINETWTVAPGRLAGIIYYNSYGTKLAKNTTDHAVGGDGTFGGAVLSIHVGDTAPKLAAGSASSDDSGCRVCHSVAAGGSRLIVQHGDNYATSSAYDLTAGGGANVEHSLTTGATFPAVYPDGSLVLSPSGQLLPLPNDATPIPALGLSTVATDLGTPAFAPDGKSIAFNPMAGPGVTNPTQKLGVMGFDVTTGAFANFVTVVDDTGKSAENRPGWPAFLPDGKSLVFHHQSAAGLDGNGSGSLWTRKGSKSQIHWTGTTAANVNALNQLNGNDSIGNSYLPKLATASTVACTADTLVVGNINPDHADDVNLNYEPTVNPRGSGGYAWVVFTSRRMYGNEATIPPFCSDPRGVDLISNITTKKLWVAAIDLGAPLGSDPSHPGFYLPAQELLAGNSRAFWVLDPCRPDGQSCATGDQCCNGYCEADGDGGALVCSNTIPNAQCAKLDDKCKTGADCCDSADSCIGGFCTQGVPR